MTSASPFPMFPLGTVLFPSMTLPLHVFEPRYRALVRDCLAGDAELGVVLIERGSEVGGGDVRTDVGTVARIIEAVELPDGRFGLGTVGQRRLRVVRWLADDPYPRAEVADWPEPPPTAALEHRLEAAVATLRRALALLAELGEPAPPATVEVSDEPILASHQAAALAPLGPQDRQRLLEAPSAEDRCLLLEGLLEEQITVLEARLRG